MYYNSKFKGENKCSFWLMSSFQKITLFRSLYSGAGQNQGQSIQLMRFLKPYQIVEDIASGTAYASCMIPVGLPWVWYSKTPSEPTSNPSPIQI